MTSKPLSPEIDDENVQACIAGLNMMAEDELYAGDSVATIREVLNDSAMLIYSLVRERESLLSDNEALCKALGRHTAFFGDVAKTCFQDASDLAYGDFLDLGVEHGLLRIEPYDLAKHGPDHYADTQPGEDWYVRTDDAALTKG